MFILNVFHVTFESMYVLCMYCTDTVCDGASREKTV